MVKREGTSPDYDIIASGMSRKRSQLEVLWNLKQMEAEDSIGKKRDGQIGARKYERENWAV